MRLDGHGRLLRANAWWLYLAAMVPVAGLYVVGPRVFSSGPAFNGIGVSAIAAMAAGVLMHRPRARAPWILFAVGQAFLVIGDVLAYNYTLFFGHALPFPSVGDGFYLAAYPALVLGLVFLIRQRSRVRDWGSLIDSVIITTGVGLLSWIFLIAPYAYDTSLSVTTKLWSIAYPLMDLLMLAVAVRLMVGRGTRGPSYWLIIASVCIMFATDAVYGWRLLHGDLATRGLLDSGWIVFYALFGAAALHPSMAASGKSDAPARVTRRRLLVLAAATFMAPVTAMIEPNRNSDTFVIGGCAIVLFSLVLLRMVGMAKAQELAAGQEYALGQERAQNTRLRELDRLKDESIATMQATQTERTRLLARTVEVAEEERVRLAADLHDGPIQKLTAMGYTLDLLASKLKRSEYEAGISLVVQIRELLTDEMDSLRKIMTALRPAILDHQSLAAAIEACADEILGPNTACVVHDRTILAGRMAPDLETVVYRVAREAIVNAQKHAEASHLSVTLERAAANISLTITDNGSGFEQHEATAARLANHLGLVSMQERVESVGGTWEITSSPGIGTTIEAHLPWRPRPNDATAPLSHPAAA